MQYTLFTVLVCREYLWQADDEWWRSSSSQSFCIVHSVQGCVEFKTEFRFNFCKLCYTFVYSISGYGDKWIFFLSVSRNRFIQSAGIIIRFVYLSVWWKYSSTTETLCIDCMEHFTVLNTYFTTIRETLEHATVMQYSKRQIYR